MPAKQIGVFEDLVTKRKNFHITYIAENTKQGVSEKCVMEMWDILIKKEDTENLMIHIAVFVVCDLGIEDKIKLEQLK